MLAPDVVAYVRAALPAPPARVLEIGAGDGALATILRAAGYDVTALDPKGGDGVLATTLADFAAPPEPFDAAVAIVSLHHVEPLAPSLDHLATLLRPGAPLVVDEIDVERFDERASAWWLQHHRDDKAPADHVAELRAHLHALTAVRAALDPWFATAEPVRGAYMYRWHIPPELRAEEERLIAAGELPAVGARFVGVRRPA
ncbi:MAG TPA: methyltransferase domain-containing protein [Solirubrobacter sp.]|nr:methyltransferase domain-containing protein [Solirubrobacter sp.]